MPIENRAVRFTSSTGQRQWNSSAGFNGGSNVSRYACTEEEDQETHTENPSTMKETPITQEEIPKTQERTANTQERIPTTHEETLRTQGKTQEMLGTREETWITQTSEILKSQVDTKGRTRFIGDEYQFAKDLFEQPRRNKNYLTRSEKRQHNRRGIWTCSTVQLKKE